jgi:transcriptional regulator with XRE-family HTH domain
MAEAAGMTPSSWSDYERGKRLPRRKQMERIAAALRCDVKTLEQEALKIGSERFATESPREAPVPTETSDSLLKDTDRELREIDHDLDSLLVRKKLLLAFRHYLLRLPPGTPVPAGR